MGKYGTENQFRQDMGKFDTTNSERKKNVCSEKRLNCALMCFQRLGHCDPKHVCSSNQDGSIPASGV